MAVKKSKKCSGFVISSYLKNSAFTAVYMYTKFKTRYVKEVPFVNSSYMKGVPFLPKIVYKKVRG